MRSFVGKTWLTFWWALYGVFCVIVIDLVLACVLYAYGALQFSFLRSTFVLVLFPARLVIFAVFNIGSCYLFAQKIMDALGMNWSLEFFYEFVQDYDGLRIVGLALIRVVTAIIFLVQLIYGADVPPVLNNIINSFEPRGVCFLTIEINIYIRLSFLTTAKLLEVGKAKRAQNAKLQA